MILFAIPIILLLYFTFTQFVSIAGTFFGSLHQAATGNSTLNMSQLNSSIQNLALPGNISLSLTDTIKTEITQFISYTASSVITLISSIPLLAAQVLILIFSVFYFAKDGDKVVQYKDVIPDNDKKFYMEIFNSADDVFKALLWEMLFLQLYLEYSQDFYISSPDILM
jgi:predicted PurR-regulated permease PerM